MSQSAVASADHKPRWKVVVSTVAGVLCFALLVWMVWKSGPLQLWHTLCSMPITIALCVAVWAVGYLLNAASFRHVITGVLQTRRVDKPVAEAEVAATAESDPGMESTAVVPSFARVLRLTVAGYALNYITPFGLLGGEPWRIVQLRPALGTRRATQSVVHYSLMHVASHFCLWLLSLGLAMATVPSWRQVVGHPRIVVAVLVILLVALIGWLWHKLPSLTFVRALGLELLSRLVNVVEYWLVMQALGYDSFGYVQALLVVAFSSLLANILFFSPMQLGTREAGILLALEALLPGQLLPVALTLSFATRIREFVWIAIGLLVMRGK